MRARADDRMRNIGTARRRLAALLLCLLACLTAACRPGVAMRGVVRDISGCALPGVAVSVDAAGDGVITDILGNFSLRAAPGAVTLHFEKTGYTSAAAAIDVTRGGAVTVPEIRLWPLPPAEGVHLFEGGRHTELDHPRPMPYTAGGGTLVHGTAVSPKTAAENLFSGTGAPPGPPLLIAHKLPPYDARLVRMRLIDAATPQPASPASTRAAAAPVLEKVWVAAETLPLVMRPLDEPNRQLVALMPGAELEPGIYAVHWGALDGFPGVEPRIFLFRVPDPAAEDDDEGEARPSPEEQKMLEDRERQRRERLKEMNQETGEGMG